MQYREEDIEGLSFLDIFLRKPDVVVWELEEKTAAGLARCLARRLEREFGPEVAVEQCGDFTLLESRSRWRRVTSPKERAALLHLFRKWTEIPEQQFWVRAEFIIGQLAEDIVWLDRDEGPVLVKGSMGGLDSAAITSHWASGIAYRLLPDLFPTSSVGGPP